MVMGCTAAGVLVALLFSAPFDPASGLLHQGNLTIGAKDHPSEWAAAPLSIDSRHDYIIETQFTVKRGVVWLKAELLDAQGNLVRELATNTPMPGEPPHWLVLHVPPVDGAEQLRVRVGGDAEATLALVRVLPYSPRVIGNGDFSLPLDRKNRISLWNLEEAAVLPAPRAGAATLDRAQGRSANGCVHIEPQHGWAGLSSINYPVPTWSDRFRAEAWARTQPDGEAAAAIVWSDDSAQNVLRVDVGPASSGNDWFRIATPDVSPPPDAKTFRVVLLAQRGAATFDDADFIALPPSTPHVRVLVNQAGYETHAAKRAIVMTNVLPPTDAAPVFTVFGAAAEPLKRASPAYTGRVVGQGGADWGWYFWRADFDDVKYSGTVTIHGELGTASARSHPVEIQPNRLFYATAAKCVDFFFVQRCGGNVPGWHRPCHMDDAKMPDGTHRDLTGGWHSAGDYNKLTWEYGDGGVTYALAVLLEADPVFCARFNRDEAHYEDAFDEAIWGAQYLAKLQTETGGFLNHIEQGPDKSSWMKWAAPDEHTDNVRGTTDDPVVTAGEGRSPLAIGAWARLSVLLDQRKRSNDFLDRAIRAWEYASKTADSDPLLLISTIDLFNVTRDDRFRDFARTTAEKMLNQVPETGMLRGGYADSGDVPAAALAHFVNEMPSDALKARIKARLRAHIEAFVVEPDNAFGISRQKFGEDGYFFEPSSTLGHNYEYLCRAWSALKVYKAVREKSTLNYALNQINFVLGANPYDLCMMEGVGAVNPPRYHHRYIKIPTQPRGAVPGAIPNGFVRDMIGQDRPGFDLSLGGREYPSYRTSEPWLVHNVFYLLAVCALHDAQSK